FEEQNNEFNKQIKVLNEKNADLLDQTEVLQEQLKVKHVVIDIHTECQAQQAKVEEERYEYMIRYFALFDNDKQHRKQIADQEVLFDKIRIDFENPSYFEKAKDLRPTLYDDKVIGLGYTSMFLTHSDEALEIEKFKRSRENKIEFAYDYGNLNASYVNEKIDSPFQQTSSLKPYVPNVILEKIIIDLEDEVMSLLEKEKENLKTIESLKSKGFESSEKAIFESENQGENDCLKVEKECDKVENSKVIALGMFKLSVSQSVSPILMSKSSCDSKNVENLETFSSVRRPKNSGVIWKKKGSSNTFNVDLFAVSLSKLNKNVKRYSRKDLLSWNIHRKHHKSKTAFASNEPLYLLHMDLCGPMRVQSINGKRYGLVVVDDYSWYTWVFFLHSKDEASEVIISFIKKTQVNLQLQVQRIRTDNGTVFKNKNLAKFFVEVDDYSRYTWVFFLHSKDEASEVIISFIKKTQVNLQLQVQRIRTDNGTEFKSKTLAKFFDEVGITQQFFAARTPQQNGVVERRNQTLVEAARIILTFANLPLFLWAEAIATACFTQNRSIIHKRFDKTPYELINKRKPNIKFFHVFGCRCYLLNEYEDAGKLKAKEDIGVFVGYSKESAAFRIYNKRTRKIHESVNVNFDEISEMASKQFSLEPGLSNLNEMGKSSNPSIMKSSTTNVETPIIEEVFHEISESFHGESSSSSLNDDVQQSPEEVILPSSNTQSVPNGDEASTSYNVFNERLEDAYFDASTSFQDPSNIHTYYQPYPHEKKWTKDHPLHKIIGDPKSIVRTRGQLANSCLFSCLLTSIEPANVAEALRDADWVSAMQEELD
nr:hypothetical protein [Tanacetum cinerariifolium]